MKVGNYTVFHTETIILPANDKAIFDVGPTTDFAAKFVVVLSWTPGGSGGKGSFSWEIVQSEESTEIRISFEKLRAPFGGAVTGFNELGAVSGRPFGFRSFFQTYEGGLASLTLQFLVD